MNPKVGIIGTGSVGVRYAYALMIKGCARSIVLIDADKKRAEGEAMDLSHGMPFIAPVEIVAGEYPDLKESDLVVITAGKKQKPGQTRLELVKDNVAIFKEIVPGVVKYAPQAVIMVATNPVDVLSYAAYKISGKPWSAVIGSGTVLDSARFRFLLGRHCNIDTRNVHAYVLGEHGDSEFAVWSKAMFGGLLLNEYCPLCGNCPDRGDLKRVFEDVRDSAYKIIERKGETSYGIGLAMARITEAILKDENSILPVSTLINDYYGVNDVYLSLPCVVNSHGVREQLKLKLDDAETDNLRRSAAVIAETIKQAGL